MNFINQNLHKTKNHNSRVYARKHEYYEQKMHWVMRGQSTAYHKTQLPRQHIYWQW